MGERRGTKALELWCKRMTNGYAGVRIDNMTTSWRDGLGFCSLIHHFRPDLINFDELKQENIYYNNELAFRVAEEYLNIPALLDPNDMLAYEVPDRLSILTYLSQFYQVFGAQESSLARLKRASSEASKSPQTPVKMAHVVPKREPCLKCNLPVFFAERLVVDKKLFHRSCLKCARCDSKLTIGNFYETEEDNVFCCETCPDEETVQTRDEKPAESSRLSMAQRISMFEKDQSVLKKSLSDEEKSRSLKRQAEIQDLKSPASTKALNSFLAAQIDQVHDQKQDLHGKMEDSSSSESDDEPPPLPREAQPQINRLGLNDFSDNLSNQLVGSSIVTKATGEGKVKTIDPVDDEFDAILQKMAEDDVITKSKTIEKAPEVFNIKVVPVIIQNPEESENVSEKVLESSSKMESHEITNVTELDNFPKPAITIPENIESIPETPAIAHESFVNDLSTEITPDSSEFPVESLKIEDLTEKHIEDLTQETTNIIIDKESDEKPLIESDYELKVVPEVVVEAIEQIEELIEEKEINKESDNIKPEVPIPAGNIECEVKNVPKPGDSDYPDNLNPFGSDDEDENEPVPVKLHVSSNPFGSDEEDEEVPVNRTGTLKPPRPPPPKIKPSNPFGESDDEESMSEANIPRRMPVPTPRKIGTSTPEPTLRSSMFNLNSSFKGSTNSLASDGSSTLMRKKKGKAPPPPTPGALPRTPELVSKSNHSTPSNKKRLAPLPPSSTPNSLIFGSMPSLNVTANSELSSSEKDLVGKQENAETSLPLESLENLDNSNTNAISTKSRLRLIPLEESLMDDSAVAHKEEQLDHIIYRRNIMPLSSETTMTDDSFEISQRQWEKMKENKESQNRNRQSQGSLGSIQSDSADAYLYFNKSSHGKWKRRKGAAPAPPPVKKILQMLPLQEIRHELEVIEVQQQGLEKQGVQLEKMIRERCEGPEAENVKSTSDVLTNLPETKNTKEVEDLIMQLFELVNEKNELFRRQAELMYMRRQHRLEQEQADIEYEIRLLMAQPEHNKTDSDKTREEGLIARLMEVVQLRNAVVDCLEMDRLREAEEDMSIKQRMELHTLKRDEELANQTPTKLSKKEKKKQKEAKKLLKNKKLDLEKDTDETEVKKEKKKKKKFLF